MADPEESNQVQPPRPRSGWHICWRDTAAVIAVLVSAELLARAISPGVGTGVFDNRFTGGHAIDINEEGYRGPLPPRHAPRGQLRILALGDSVTFGTGVAVEEAWPKQLEVSLRAERGLDVVAINGGIPAADINQLRVAYERTWRPYHADVVALLLTGNMISFAKLREGSAPSEPKGEYPPDASLSPASRLRVQAQRFLHRLALPSLVSAMNERALFWLKLANHDMAPSSPLGVLPAFGVRQPGLDPHLGQQAWSLAGQNLRQFAAEIGEDGKELLVAFSIPRFEISDSVSDNEKLVPTERFTIDAVARAAQLCDALGLPHVELLSALRAARERTGDPLYLSMDYTHYDAVGHAAVAGAFEEALAGQGQLHGGRRGGATRDSASERSSRSPQTSHQR